MEASDATLQARWLDVWAKSPRFDFPFLTQREKATNLAGVENPVFAYLDNAATTLKPSAVLQAVEGFYRDCSASPYRGQHRQSRLSTQLYETARAVVADFVGAEADELVFVRNTTEALNLVAASSLFHMLKAGDNIIVPIWEHHSNLVPWQQLCKKTGATLRFLYPDAKGRLDRTTFINALGKHTRLVVCAHISNVLGTCFDLSEIAERAHAMGALMVADCAQSVAHLPLDLHVLGVDFAAFSGHKVYAPMGIGVLYVRRELMNNMEPFLLGGEMIEDVWERDSSFAEGPKRFEAGTPDVAGALGLAVALDYLSELKMTRVQAQERELLKHLLAGMRSLPGLRVLGNAESADDRAAVVSFVLDGIDCESVARILDREGIAIRAGSQCAQPLHRYLGLSASCRISPCLYNTHTEIEYFLETMARLPKLNLRGILSSR
jgi:cysteine desulfurase/selenocysteine lyase